MNIKLDVNDAVSTTLGVSTKFGGFWRGIILPTDIGPALSFLLLVGILPFAGKLLSGIIPMPVFGVWVSFGLTWGLITGIFSYVFFVGMPLLMGIILGAMDQPLNINKSQAAGYTTVLAYAMAPAAVGNLLVFIPYLGMLVAFAFGVISLIALYLGLTEGIGMESGQAIIMILITIVATAIIYSIIFMFLIGAIVGVGTMGMYRSF